MASATKLVTAVVVGAGSRGTTYTSYALDAPEQLKIVGVAEPREYRRHLIASHHSIPEDKVFTDWRELAAVERCADVAIITTQDQMHADPAVAFAAKGYHILLEKPMAVTEEDCERIAAACDSNGVMLCICHVLRYSPTNMKLKEMIDAGAIGRVINLNHTEPVGYFHYAHSYVRGNWRREEESTFALMAKSCHDIDLIRWWMGGECLRVSSFGSLSEFHPARKPAEASGRCVSCPDHVERACPYSALKIYLEKGAFVSHIVDGEVTPQSVMKALEDGPYGRCVWQSDNDVVDNQVVNLEFDGGRTASFTMVAFSDKLCQRETTFYGTTGQLRCFDADHLEHVDYTTGERRTIVCPGPPVTSRLGGHGGSDYFLMRAFVQAVAQNNPSLISTSASDALASHKLVFRAEQARREGRVVAVSPKGSA